MLTENSQNTVTSYDFEMLRKYIKDHCGIVIGDGKEYLVETRFAKLLVETGCQTFGQLYKRLITNSIPGLRDKIIDAITTHETSWFRDKYPFELLKLDILPRLAREKNGVKFRIWSCGCSTGQEPYSISMTIHDFCRENTGSGLSPDDFEIIASDISSSVLFLAQMGRYDKLAMKRGISDEMIDKHFAVKGSLWTVNKEIREIVKFKKLNLQDDTAKLGAFDIIFCRNVLIYFSTEFKIELFGKFSNALKPDGYLILGAAETTFGYSNKYHIDTNDNGTYYKLAGETP